MPKSATSFGRMTHDLLPSPGDNNREHESADGLAYDTV
jgi:hypothetical protein